MLAVVNSLSVNILIKAVFFAIRSFSTLYIFCRAGERNYKVILYLLITLTYMYTRVHKIGDTRYISNLHLPVSSISVRIPNLIHSITYTTSSYQRLTYRETDEYGNDVTIEPCHRLQNSSIWLLAMLFIAVHVRCVHKHTHTRTKVCMQ